MKRLEIQEKLKASGINPESIIRPLESIITSTSSLQAEPIILDESIASNIVFDNENEESNDIDEE